MLAGGSEAAVHFFPAALAKSRRQAAGSTAAQIHPYINVVGGSLTIPRHHSLSKGEVGGIHPTALRPGTTMTRDAYGWHDICFYLVEDDVGRASVVSMNDPVKPQRGYVYVDGRSRRPMSPLQGASDRISSNHTPPADEATMAR